MHNTNTLDVPFRATLEASLAELCVLRDTPRDVHSPSCPATPDTYSPHPGVNLASRRHSPGKC